MIRQTLIAAALLLPTTFMTSTALAADAEAIFAGGCFWCIEKDFEKIKGVKEVKSGYSGGTLANPTYKNHSGHREVVKIFYDDSKVSYDQLLNFFFRTVDPTDGGGQFCDRGFAYSTAVYAMNGKELESAQKAKAEEEAQKEATVDENARKRKKILDLHIEAKKLVESNPSLIEKNYNGLVAYKDAPEHLLISTALEILQRKENER